MIKLIVNNVIAPKYGSEPCQSREPCYKRILNFLTKEIVIARVMYNVIHLCTFERKLVSLTLTINFILSSAVHYHFIFFQKQLL